MAICLVADGRVIAFARVDPPAVAGSRPRSSIMLFDVASGGSAAFDHGSRESPSATRVRAWGKEIAFVTRMPLREQAVAFGSSQSMVVRRVLLLRVSSGSPGLCRGRTASGASHRL
jgi:hypothetical protein